MQAILIINCFCGKARVNLYIELSIKIEDKLVKEKKTKRAKKFVKARRNDDTWRVVDQ